MGTTSRFTWRLVVAAFFLFVLSTSAALFNHKWENDRLTLVPDKARTEGEWHSGLDLLKPSRAFGNEGINIEIREGNSTYGFYLPTERAPRIEGKTSDSDHVHFAITADSGDLQFDGTIKGKSASGHYVFEPNKEYATEAGKLLKEEVANDELLKLAFARISLGYIRGVIEVIPSVGLEDVVRLRNFGLEPNGIRAYVAAGFSKTEDLTKLRSHGVTPEYATQARAAGYGKTEEELTRLRNFGVTPEYLTGWKDAGFAFSAEQIVRLRNFNVQPEFGAGWKKAGYEIDPEALIRAKNFGVPLDFAAAVAGANPKPTMEEIVRMRNFGINGEYYRSIKECRPGFTTEEIIRLKQFGVTPEYVKAVIGSRNDFTAEQIVKLRNFGVPSEYVAALNVPDRKPLDAEAIIDLRNRGVSAETARKLRE